MNGLQLTHVLEKKGKDSYTVRILFSVMVYSVTVSRKQKDVSNTLNTQQSNKRFCSESRLFSSEEEVRGRLKLIQESPHTYPPPQQQNQYSSGTNHIIGKNCHSSNFLLHNQISLQYVLVEERLEEVEKIVEEGFSTSFIIYLCVLGAFAIQEGLFPFFFAISLHYWS